MVPRNTDHTFWGDASALLDFFQERQGNSVLFRLTREGKVTSDEDEIGSEAITLTKYCDVFK